MSKIKLPKLFSRPLTKTDLEKRIYRKIYLKEYRDFVAGVLQEDATGNFTVRENINQKELAKLKKIAHSIRKNTGFVQRGKLIFAGILVAGITIFMVFFKDSLVENAAERGLEAVFQARCDFKDLRFRLLGGQLFFSHLEVANSSQPMYNLFELGATEIRLNIPELLKGNVIVENLQCEEIRWDTPRQFSGALPGRKLEVNETVVSSEEASDPLAFLNDVKAGALAVIEKEKDNLQSLKTLLGLTKEYSKLLEDRDKKRQKLLEDYKGVENAVKKVTAIDVKKIKSMTEIKAAFDLLTTAYQEVSTYKKELESTANDLAKDLAKIMEEQKVINRAIEADLKWITDTFNAPVTSGRSVIGKIAERLLGFSVGQIINYIKLGLGYFNQLKPKAPQQAKLEPQEEQYGLVYFPGKNYPRFLLQHAACSFGQLAGDHLRFELRNLTGQPDLLNAPCLFNYEQKKDKLLFTVKGTIDARSNSKEAFQAEIRLAGLPFSDESSLVFLGVQKMTAQVELGLKINIDKDGANRGSISCLLTDLILERKPEISRYGEHALAALAAVNAVNVEGEYHLDSQGHLSLGLSTNLDKILEAVIKALVTEVLNEVRQRVKEELTRLLADPLKEYQGLASNFFKQDELFKGDLNSLKEIEKLLDKKKAEVTNAAKAIGGGALGELDKLKNQFGF